MHGVSTWPGDDPVATAQVADCMAWSPETTSSRRNALLLRDEAVRKALATGIPAQQIAEALGVRPEDVDRMAQRPQPV
jgi:hypothetical protein